VSVTVLGATAVKNSFCRSKGPKVSHFRKCQQNQYWCQSSRAHLCFQWVAAEEVMADEQLAMILAMIGADSRSRCAADRK
jgi:hypothetical protein